MIRSRVRALCICAAMVFSSSVLGQTWDGGGAVGGALTWSTATNWNPDGVPVNNGTANIVMSGTIDLTNAVDVNFDINSLTFANTAGINQFTIANTGGAVLTVRGGGITNNDADLNSLSLPISLAANQTWSAAVGNLSHASGQSLALNANTLTLAGAATTTLGSPISGAGSIVVGGTGSVVLSSGANSYTGGTTLNSGTLILNTGPVLGGGTLTLNGGTLQAQIVSITIANATTIGGNFTVGGSLGVTASGAMTLTGDRTVTINNTGSTVFSGAIGQDAAGRAFTKSGTGSLTFSGSTANTYSGNTVVNSGFLNLQKTTGVNAIAGGVLAVGDGSNIATVRLGASNQIIDTCAVLVNHAGALDLNGASETIQELAMLGSGLVTTGGGTLTVNSLIQATPGSAFSTVIGNLSLAGGTRNVTVAAGTGSLDLSAVISNGGINKLGDGTLNFGGGVANTYTGTTTVNSGTLILNKTSGVASINGPLVLNAGNATTVAVATGGQIAIGVPITLNGGTTLRLDAGNAVGPVTFASGGTIDIGALGSVSLFTTVTSQASANQAVIGNLSVDRAISLGGSSKTFDVADGAASVDMLISGALQTGSLVKTGAGTLRIGGQSTNNTFSGLTVNAGTVVLGKFSNVDAATGNIIVGDGVGGGLSDVLRLQSPNQIAQTVVDTVTVNSSGLFDLNGFAESIGNLQLNSGVVNGGTLRFSGSVASSAQPIASLVSSTIDLSASTTVFNVADGVASEDLLMSGTIDNGSLMKSGTGLMRLAGSGANSASFAQISGGTLLLDKAPGVDAVGGTVLGIGDGVGSPQSDVVRFGASDDQIPDVLTVNLASTGLLDLNGRNDTVGGLIFNGSGVVNSGAGTLTVVNQVNSNSAATTGSIAGKLSLGGDVLPFDVADGSAVIDLNVGATLLNGTLRKIGSGNLALSAISTHDASIDLVAGTISGGFYVSPTRTFTQSAGSTFSSGSLENHGTFVFNGGTFTGDLLNFGTTVFNADFVAGDGISNDGTFVVSTGRVISGGLPGVYNSFAGTITLAGGTIQDELINDGVISGFGTISGLEGFTNQGQLVVSGGTLTLTNVGPNTNLGSISVGQLRQLSLGTGLINQGLITLSGGMISGSGTLTNALGGEIRGGSSVQSPLTNDGGLIHAVAGSVLGISNLSGGNINGGELRLDDNATLNVASVFASSGTIVLNGANSILNGGAITHTGTLRGQGRVSNVVLNSGTVRSEGGTLTLVALGNTNAAGGRIEAGAGSQVLYSRGLATNAGQIALTGGSFDNNNNVMANPGAIEGYGTIRTGGLTNTGSISVGGNLDVLGAVTNSGTVSTQSGSTVRFFGAVNGAGSYTGTGTTMFLNTFSPGNSPAIVNVTGNMILTGTATLQIEIGGFTPGAEHDQVNVGQTLALGGRLDITNWNGFQILPGDEFTVLTFGTRANDFASMTFTGNTFAGLGVQRVFTANSMIVKGTGLAGDANLDGSVDFDDLLILAQNYNTSGANWFSGDFNRTGTVNFDDLLLVAQNYGQHLLTSEIVAGDVNTLGQAFASDFALARGMTPEPAAVGLIALMALNRRRRIG